MTSLLQNSIFVTRGLLCVGLFLLDSMKGLSFWWALRSTFEGFPIQGALLSRCSPFEGLSFSRVYPFKRHFFWGALLLRGSPFECLLLVRVFFDFAALTLSCIYIIWYFPSTLYPCVCFRAICFYGVTTQ